MEIPIFYFHYSWHDDLQWHYLSISKRGKRNFRALFSCIIFVHYFYESSHKLTFLTRKWRTRLVVNMVFSESPTSGKADERELRLRSEHLTQTWSFINRARVLAMPVYIYLLHDSWLTQGARTCETADHDEVEIHSDIQNLSETLLRKSIYITGFRKNDFVRMIFETGFW